MRNVFETTRRHSSVSVAKDRLKTLLFSDRVSCTPDTIDKLKEELYLTVSKYIEIAPDTFDVNFSQSNIVIRISKECN